jgi:hypothetical protein
MSDDYEDDDDDDEMVILGTLCIKNEWKFHHVIEKIY